MSIELSHINKSFGSYQALRDVSLSIRDGELVALLGPSGSGKTTLLRIIAGLDTPKADSRSRIRFYEEDVASRPAAQRQVGFVFQHYALFRHMSIFENVAFGMRVMSRGRVRVKPRSNVEYTSCWASCNSTASADAFRRSYPAVSVNGRHSPGRSLSNRKYCCLMSRSAH